jgi:hypothetical protein
MHDSARRDMSAGHRIFKKAFFMFGMVVIPTNFTLTCSALAFDVAMKALVLVCAICWTAGELRTAVWFSTTTIVTAKAIAPAINTFLFIRD